MASGDIPMCPDCGEYMYTYSAHDNCGGLTFPKYDSYYDLQKLTKKLAIPYDFLNNDSFPDYNPVKESKIPMLADLLRQKAHDANVVQVNLAYDRMINLVKDEADEGYRESHFMVKALKLSQPAALNDLIDKLRADGLEVNVIMKHLPVGPREQLVIKW
jgi:hypothetical protein